MGAGAAVGDRDASRIAFLLQVVEEAAQEVGALENREDDGKGRRVVDQHGRASWTAADRRLSRVRAGESGSRLSRNVDDQSLGRELDELGAVAEILQLPAEGIR